MYLPPAIFAIATGIVCNFEFCKNTSAKINSFHVSKNNRITAEAMAGLDNGRIICKNILKSEAPSILADSFISLGICSKNERSIRVAIGIRNPT
ncbi:unnamed protein product [marine sediment metagenome]|uniref:Uncharacterized protein n=1 Tax=marine sediment metagenome TaxID=412755 RepID=X1EG79_9ZZZZ